MAVDPHRDDADIPEVTLVFEDDDEDVRGTPTFVQDNGGRRAHVRPPRSSSRRPRSLWRADPSEPHGHRLPEIGPSSGILAAALVVIAVVGVMVVNLAGSVAMTGITTTLALGSAMLPQWLASVGSALFGTFGATLLSLAIYLALAWKAASGRGQAFLVTMGSAWMLSGLVATVTIGSTPYLFSALSFVAALACALTLISPGAFRVLSGLTGGLAVLAFGASVVYVGTTTALGALASVLVGGIGVALGALVWNRWWAPILETRDRAAAAMGAAMGAGRPRGL